MAHLSSLSVKNFRIFKQEQEFTFSPITVLTGANSSGKTSVIQALLLLKKYLGQQSYGRANFKNLNQLQKLTHRQIDERLGDFSKLLNIQSSAAGERVLEFKILCHFHHEMEEDVTLTLKFLQSGEKVYEGQLVHLSLRELKEQENILSIEKENQSWMVNINYFYFFKKFEHRFFDYKLSRYTAAGEGIFWQDHLFEFVKNEQGSDASISDEVFEEKNDSITKADLTGILDMYTDAFLTSKERARLILGIYDEWIFDLKAYVDEYFEGSELEEEIILSIKIEIHKAANAALKEAIDAYRTKENPSVLLLRNFRFLYTPHQKEEALTSILQLISDPIKVLENNAGTINLKFDKKLNQYLRAHNYRVTIIPFKERDGWSADADDKTDDERFFRGFIYQNITQCLEARMNSFSRFGYLPSIRNLVKRVYDAKKEETEFSELIVHFLEYGIDNHKDIMDFITYFVREFEIGDGIAIEQSSGGAMNQFYITEGDTKVLLADLGYGISQFMPVLLKIAIQAYESYALNNKNFFPSTICIEEPETNLHPALQSKLADLLVEAYQRFGIQFIIETHSEYLIRKLQFLVGRKEAAPDDVLIYYFQKSSAPDQGVEVKTIEINEYGGLTDEFGSGFFDEATHWKFELVKLNNPQKN